MTPTSRNNLGDMVGSEDREENIGGDNKQVTEQQVHEHDS